MPRGALQRLAIHLAIFGWLAAVPSIAEALTK
jgi:hypothetical protein